MTKIQFLHINKVLKMLNSSGAKSCIIRYTLLLKCSILSINNRTIRYEPEQQIQKSADIKEDTNSLRQDI